MNHTPTGDSVVLKNNPFVPPPNGRCIINDLPAELLSQIFVAGAESEHHEEPSEEDEHDGSCDSMSELDSDGGSDCSQQSLSSDDERHLPYEFLVTRICKRWREVAIEIPSLWSDIVFTPDTDTERVREYVRRAKGAPLDISIDITTGDDEGEDEEDERWETESVAAQQPEFKALVDVLDILITHVRQWKSLDLMVSHYFPMLYAIKQFAQCESAPILESLKLYHYEDSDDVDTFHPVEYKDLRYVLFHNEVPKLKEVALWGVHLDWKNTTFLANLHSIELAYHTLDVRPSYRDFSRILKSSPQLHALTLCQSGPAGMPVEWLESLNEDTASTNPSDLILDISLPSVTDLVLAFLPPDYTLALLERMHLPNVTTLALDFEQDEYRSVLEFLSTPRSGSSKSLLAGLKAFKLSGLPCAHTPTVVKAAEALTNVKQISINFHHVDQIWSDMLGLPVDVNTDNLPAGTLPVFFPSLETLHVTGISGDEVRTIVEDRIGLGKALSAVYLNREEYLEPEDRTWLEQNLVTFEQFDGSDDEDDDMEDTVEFGIDLSDVDEEEIAEDDQDEDWTDEDEDDEWE